MSLVIGIVMDYLIPGVIEGAGAYARQHGLRVDARWSVRADWMPEKTKWHGVLINIIDMENAFRRTVALDLPMVHLGGWFGNRSRPRVEPDYAICGRLAALEFKRIGCARVAAMPMGGHPVNWRSHRGLRVAMREEELEWVPLTCWDLGRGWVRDVRRVANEIAASSLPCGLFMAHAGAAVGLIDELLSLGLRIPEDVPIIVIDKDPQKTAELSPVPLTGVVPDDWQQGYEAAAMLHRMLLGEKMGQRIVRVAPGGLFRRASTGVERSHDPLVAKALHAIREYPLQELGVNQLVNLVGASRRNLEQRFQKAVGETLHEAITKRRIDESKRRLRNGDLSIIEVAEQCGYSSVHYFTVAFRRECGMPPGVYRRTHG